MVASQPAQDETLSRHESNPSHEHSPSHTSKNVKFPNALPIVDEYNEDSEHQVTENPLVANEAETDDPNHDEAQSLFDLANAYISMADKEEAQRNLSPSNKVRF